MNDVIDVIDIISQFYSMTATYFRTKVQVFHYDNGHEFVNQSFIGHMTSSTRQHVIISHNKIA